MSDKSLARVKVVLLGEDEFAAIVTALVQMASRCSTDGSDHELLALVTSAQKQLDRFPWAVVE